MHFCAVTHGPTSPISSLCLNLSARCLRHPNERDGSPGQFDNDIFEVSLGALDISWLHDTIVHPVVCENDVSYLPA